MTEHPHPAVQDIAPTEGWVYPLNARKAHYFYNELVSLCRGWMMFSLGAAKPDTFESPDDCKTCRRKLTKIQEEAKDAVSASSE